MGIRRFTPYGKSAAQIIAKDLASRNIFVVSGLARDIDTIAYKTAVQTGGRILAVLGSRRDVIYPGENRRLGEDIYQKRFHFNGPERCGPEPGRVCSPGTDQ